MRAANAAEPSTSGAAGVPRLGDLLRAVAVVHAEVNHGDAARQATAVML